MNHFNAASLHCAEFITLRLGATTLLVVHFLPTHYLYHIKKSRIRDIVFVQKYNENFISIKNLKNTFSTASYQCLFTVATATMATLATDCLP